MKLQDGMVVKRKDNGLKGVAHKLQGGMWKVKYHDGTHTYTTESAFKNHFIIPELEIEFEDDSVVYVCVEHEQEESMTYDEYLNQSDDVVTKHLEKEAHKTMELLFEEYEPTNDSKCDGVEPKTIEELFDGYESDNGLIDKQEHYTNNGIQPIEIMKANMSSEEFHGFLLANVWKYTMRYKDKNGLEDIRKAKTYLNWLEVDIEALGSDIYWKM